MKDQLDSLVGLLVERGVHLDEAVNEFEKKFISRAPPACWASTATHSAAKWTSTS
jgi:hypothetical protein